ncbi:POU domain, class 4, transcription factor 2-like [Uranotaenia lowii]|uniref:POU domain, class 4, transcription factor 2-like n=1 Tax=Uranotaenia lowii TaxID=190385 RepID=UPI0024787AB5|nr:POU domain, class 4, transcription factor 2-like [Uranotaenia lowii]
MKLFPNYTPPIPPHNNTSSSNNSTLSNNHHYHQITYQAQTLAPLRLNQEHFSKTNTLGAGNVLGPSPNPLNGPHKYQTTHHHHHHHHHQQPPYDYPHHQQHSHSDTELDHDDDITLDEGEDDSMASNITTSPTHTPQSDGEGVVVGPSSPPELPIRNGLIGSSTLNHNHINQNGGPKGSGPIIGTGRKMVRQHYH